jgi:hypothetical protein
MSGTIGMWTRSSSTNAQATPARTPAPTRDADEETEWTLLTRRTKARTHSPESAGPPRRPDSGRTFPPATDRLPERATVSGEIGHDEWAEALRRAKQRH